MIGWQKAPPSEDIDQAKATIEAFVRDSQPHLPVYSDLRHPVNPLEWLKKSGEKAKIFWSNRDESDTMAGVGVSDSLSGKGIMTETGYRSQKRLCRYFGGSFFDGKIEQMWSPLWWTNGRRLIYNPPIGKCHSLIDAIPFHPESNPSKSKWITMMNKAMSHLESRDIDKIVLARQLYLKMDRCAYSCLERLMEDQTSGFAFAFQPSGDRIFIGRSPERLFRISEDGIQTEAIAGTRSKGSKAIEDELLSSDKDRREHQLVVDGIVSALRSLELKPVAEKSPKIVESGSLIHLKTKISCENIKHINADSLMNVLHPTAAVCGTPTQKAFELISEIEEFDRGWFAGPIGWCDSTSAEFAVAIRSATFSGYDALVYAGAGIVRGSDPILEWREIASKSGQYDRFRIKA